MWFQGPTFHYEETQVTYNIQPIYPSICCVLFVCPVSWLRGFGRRDRNVVVVPDCPEEMQRHVCACLHVSTCMYVHVGMHLPECVPMLECTCAYVCSTEAVKPLSSSLTYPGAESGIREFQKAMELLYSGLPVLWSRTVARAGTSHIVWHHLSFNVLGAHYAVQGTAPDVYERPALWRGQHSSMWSLWSLPKL